jgi:hypothetical protein
MRRKIIFIGSIFLSIFSTKAQEIDSSYKKITLKKTQLEFIYNHYNQDGNNSAVTGGIGTEQLTVNAPLILYTKPIKEKGELTLKVGADFITSASTDRIDYVVSSASREDVRVHLDVNYKHDFEKITLSGGTGFSLESDYSSLPISLGVSTQSENKMRTYSANLKMYFDDLRWGRLNPDYFRPYELIYPVELRDKKWFDIYNRNSYNFQFGFTQILNKRNILGIFPEIHYQEGLLSTPFHRVYFNEGSLKVENLPSQRLKILLGIKLNTFVGGKFVLKNKADFYADNFGISGFGFEHETVFKVSNTISLKPSFRIYFQNASKYFAGYKEHSIAENFYTSDYDLSRMTTYTTGFSFKYSPSIKISKRLFFNSMELSYSNYQRSNNLIGHILGCSFKTDFVK